MKAKQIREARAQDDSPILMRVHPEVVLTARDVQVIAAHLRTPGPLTVEQVSGWMNYAIVAMIEAAAEKLGLPSRLHPTPPAAKE